MRKAPVILIPGIQGTTLLDSNQQDFKTVWSGVRKFFSNIHQLALRNNGVSDKYLDTIIERADVEDLAYSEIINYLKTQGYRVYIFGYDWRKSNADTAIELERFINKLRLRYGNIKRFNFLTHSMGALVFSAYLKSLSEQQREQVVEHAVLTAPPFLGSVEAAVNLTVGRSMLFNSSDDFRKVARTFPAIYELLPVYQGAFDIQDPQTSATFNPYQFDSYWQQVANADRPDTLKKHKLIKTRLEKLGQVRDQDHFIFNFNQASDTLRERCVVISGVGAKTRQQTKVINNHKHYQYFFEFEDEPSSKQGDGTVPSISAHAFKDALLTFQVKKRKIESWLDSRGIGGSDQHAFFLNNGRVQNIITRFLADKTDRQNWFESADDGVSKVN